MSRELIEFDDTCICIHPLIDQDLQVITDGTLCFKCNKGDYLSLISFYKYLGVQMIIVLVEYVGRQTSECNYEAVERQQK